MPNLRVSNFLKTVIWATLKASSCYKTEYIYMSIKCDITDMDMFPQSKVQVQISKCVLHVFFKTDCKRQLIPKYLGWNLIFGTHFANFQFWLFSTWYITSFNIVVLNKPNKSRLSYLYVQPWIYLTIDRWRSAIWSLESVDGSM